MPSVAVIVMGCVPVGVPTGIVIINEDVPEAVSWFGVKLAVQPFGIVEVERVIVLVYPFRNVAVTVEVPDGLVVSPALMVIGVADRVKSGVSEGEKFVVIGLPKPVTKS